VKVMVLNGPNLNLLGTREPEVYGSATLGDVQAQLVEQFPGTAFDFVQDNHEGGLVDALHRAQSESFDGVVLNAGAYTHTSVALRDAISAIATPVIELHISNTHGRESFRRRSLIAGVCVGQITGLGVTGYRLAVSFFVDVDTD